MARFRRMHTLQTFAAVHASFHNCVALEPHFTDRETFKAAAAARRSPSCAGWSRSAPCSSNTASRSARSRTSSCRSASRTGWGSWSGARSPPGCCRQVPAVEGLLEAQKGEGRLKQTSGAANPAFNKLTQRNWAIAAELERVAGELGRSMAQVAVNWVANWPGVASVLVGATKLAQLHDNLQALDFDLPPELAARLDAVSKPEPRFPYTFFEPDTQPCSRATSRSATSPPATPRRC